MEYTTTNPATGELLERFEKDGPEEVHVALDLARKAVAQLRESSVAQRGLLLTRVAELLKRDRDELARVMTVEMGKPLGAAEAEIDKCGWVCRYYAENGSDFLAPQHIRTDGTISYVTFEPLGVVLAIMPWNYPFWQVLRFAAPALMAGNGILLKHAPNVPRCAAAIEVLFLEAGFSKGVVQNMMLDDEAVGDVIADPRINAVTLTGSVRAGRAVAARAGAHIKKTVLELGGSDPFVVLADADLDLALSVAVTARMQNNGQTCIAAKRFIVEDALVEPFTAGFVAATKGLVVGDPMDPRVDVGPLARSDIRDNLHDQVVRSVAAGATLLTGGKPIPGPGFYYEPTVLFDVSPGMAVFDEETFGPVAAIVPARDEADVLRLANAGRYGLGATVFTADPEKAEHFAASLETGNVFVNGLVKSDPRLPFGGVKDSGYGRELSVFGIREFVNIKTVWIR